MNPILVNANLPVLSQLFSRLRFVFISLAFFSSIFSLAPQVVLASNQSADETNKITIANFEYVSPSIWRGAAPSNTELHQLANNGVRTIIDLRMNKGNCLREQQAAQQLGINYVHLPMGFNSPRYVGVKEFLKIVSDPVNQPVFIHCHQGADRTGLLVGIYRILVENWTLDRTYSEMRSHHFKPWLVSMKRSIIAVATDDSVKHSLQSAIEEAKVTDIDSSAI